MIHAFLKSISVIRNAKTLVQNLNYSHRFSIFHAPKEQIMAKSEGHSAKREREWERERERERVAYFAPASGIVGTQINDQNFDWWKCLLYLKYWCNRVFWFYSSGKLFAALLYFFLISGIFFNIFLSLFRKFRSPGDLVSIPGCVIPKTLKMVLDTSLLNTQQCNVRIKGKVEQYVTQGYLLKSERNSATRVRTRLLRFRSPSL